MSTIEPETTSTDPLIDEVRAIRQRISEQFGNDVGKLCEHLRELEQQHPERVIAPGSSLKEKPSV